MLSIIGHELIDWQLFINKRPNEYEYPGLLDPKIPEKKQYLQTFSQKY